MSLSCADVYSPFVGEAEASVRLAFKLARGASPALLFFDEIDALVNDDDKLEQQFVLSILYPPSVLIFDFQKTNITVLTLPVVYSLPHLLFYVQR